MISDVAKAFPLCPGMFFGKGLGFSTVRERICKTPPSTLMRAADVAERQALSPYVSNSDAQALIEAARLMRAIAMAPPAEDTP